MAGILLFPPNKIKKNQKTHFRWSAQHLSQHWSQESHFLFKWITACFTLTKPCTKIPTISEAHGWLNLPMKSTQSSQEHNEKIRKCIYFSFTVTSSKLFDSFFPAAVTTLFHAEHVVHWKSRCLFTKQKLNKRRVL